MTSVVATVSVAVAVLGHALAGGAVALSVVPQLLALAGACWILGDQLAGRREWAAVMLAGVQLYVHLALGATAHEEPAPVPQGLAEHNHQHHPTMHHPPTAMAEMPAATGNPALHEGLSGALTMTAAHLLALLAGVVLIDRAHQWTRRVVRILARLVPRVPAPGIQRITPVRGLGHVPHAPRLVRRWLSSNISRRGPPGVRGLPALT